MSSMTDLRILFVARNFPPVIGGLEKNAEDFYRNVRQIAHVDLLANPLGRKNLINFTIKTFFFLVKNSRKYDVIHFNDAVLSFMIPLISIFSRAKKTFTVHGLDVVFDNPIYQFVTRLFLKQADLVFAISQYTAHQCIARGVRPDKLRIIPDGITPESRQKYDQKEISAFLEKHKIVIQNRKILVSIGRLVARKGHAWFIQSVFPHIKDDHIYIIGGDGPERRGLLQLIAKLGFSDQVYAVGRVSEKEKKIIYQIADLFIMPNISVDNDPEGFGIVLLEAGNNSIPVIATDIEGISSAVLDGITGRLIPEGDVERFIQAISDPKIDRTTIRPTIEQKFNWINIAQQYIDEFQELLQK